MKKMIPKGMIRSLIEDANIQEESRTIELTWTTGFKGMRNGWDGPYYEELSMDERHVNLSRLQSGAPLLASHDSYSLDSVIGVVERAWLEGNQGKALVRFSEDADADKIFKKVKEKVLRNVSVGYMVRKYERVDNKEEIPTYRAIDWEPHEISIVPIGFDPQAQIRTEDLEKTEVEIVQPESELINNEDQTLDPQEIKKERQQMSKPKEENTQLDVESIKQEAARAEKQRCLDITNSVRAAKLDASYAEELINEGVSFEEAGRRIFAKLAESKKEEVINPTVRIEVGTEDNEKKREGIVEAVLYRVDRSFKPSEKAGEFTGKSFLRMLESVVDRKLGESDAVFAKRAMSSSDLPYILANVAEKSLQKQYELAPRTWDKWAKSDVLRNYKEHSQVKAGDFASLVEKPEGSELEYGSTGEERELVQLKDYGIIHAFTSQMLVNDDLRVIQQLASQGGIAASRLENKRVYSALTTNKAMNDGKNLYSADHGNLGTSGAIGETTVAEAYKLMRKQKTVNGLDYLNLVPKFLICGPDQEVAARKFLTSIIPNKTGDVNIFQGSMEVIVDAEISGNYYYFAADPNLCDTVTLYRLEGQESPTVESRIDFKTKNLELSVVHACEAAPMDWRGLLFNDGATGGQ